MRERLEWGREFFEMCLHCLGEGVRWTSWHNLLEDSEGSYNEHFKDKRTQPYGNCEVKAIKASAAVVG